MDYLALEKHHQFQPRQSPPFLLSLENSDYLSADEPHLTLSELPLVFAQWPSTEKDEWTSLDYVELVEFGGILMVLVYNPNTTKGPFEDLESAMGKHFERFAPLLVLALEKEMHIHQHGSLDDLFSDHDILFSSLEVYWTQPTDIVDWFKTELMALREQRLQAALESCPSSSTPTPSKIRL